MPHAALLLATALAMNPEPEDEALPRVLFLTHSAGFAHPVVTRSSPDEPSHAERALVEAARGSLDVVPSQDCGALAPERLADYDAVVLYTTGELPVPEGAREALLEWLAAGGALVGVHSATDTFYEFPAYQEAIGGVFDGHPWTQEVRVRVEDPSHPATRHLGDSFAIDDEIYQHADLAGPPLRVLLSLDLDSVDASRAEHESVPLAWWRDYGEGRVFYTALGHRREVWDDARFRRHIVEGIRWAIEGPDLEAPRPAGALSLFGGEGLGAWSDREGGSCGWRVEDGAMVVAAGAGDAVSRERFGDHRLHLEFATPRETAGRAGQARGNSGVYLHGRYEVQVLDSYGAEELAANDCGAIYAQRAPDVRALRPAGRWQSYDVVFRAPRFDASGAKVEDARITVWHNGRRIHDGAALPGPTPGGLGEDEVAEAPLLLQDHGDPVRYRNVWVVTPDEL